MPSTFVHGLLPTSCVLYSRRFFPRLDRKELVKLAIACFITGNLPDLDVIPAALMPLQWRSIHRYWGHNCFSIMVWISVGAWALRRYVCPRFSRGSAWWLSISLVLSHVLFDAMGGFSVTMGRRVGVPLLYPFSRWELLLPFELFHNYRLNGDVNPLLGHLLSAEYWHSAIVSEVVGSLLLFALWVVGFSCYLWWRKLALGASLPAELPTREAPVDNKHVA